VEEYIDEIRRHKGDVLVITQSQPKTVATAATGLPIVCDPDRAAYRYFGLDRGRWSMFFRWNVLSRYLSLIFSGWRPRAGEAGEDMLQLGGDFIVSADRRLVFAHRSTDPADRPDVIDMVKRMQQLTFLE
jgi:AhpC/TSA antioxidant enzyme